VLSSSALACFRGAATINLTQGCAHRCTYCYARAYSGYPGDGRVILYDHIADRLADELARKRILPTQVYFSPSTDCFGPYSELQRATYDCMQLLLERGIGVAFVTKGIIGPEFGPLFKRHRSLIHAQIGLNTTDPRIARVLEPLAATPRQRLANIERLVSWNVPTEARVDPMIPYLTDTPEGLADLCRELARRSVSRISAAYLHLRPGIRARLRRELPGPVLRSRVLAAFDHGDWQPLCGAGTSIQVLPAPYRRRGFERLRTLAARHGLTLRVCACKNPDLDTAQRCNIDARNHPARTDRQLSLFDVHSGAPCVATKRRSHEATKFPCLPNGVVGWVERSGTHRSSATPLEPTADSRRPIAI
jgi:DNA repair photolyase